MSNLSFFFSIAPTHTKKKCKDIKGIQAHELKIMNYSRLNSNKPYTGGIGTLLILSAKLSNVGLLFF